MRTCHGLRMHCRTLRLLVVAVLLSAGHAPAAQLQKSPSMAEILAASKPEDWRTLDPENTLYIELPTGRVVVELNPDFAPNHVRNVKALAREKYFDGLAIVRAQDNYVVQLADPNAEKPELKRKIQNGKFTLPPEFDRPLDSNLPFTRLPDGDVYAPEVGFSKGFPVARDPKSKRMWLVHCYGMLGAGRDNAPDTGGGTELYVVIGHAPRQLDRNVTLFGRVVKGMELLSVLPRGTGNMGFYEKPEQHMPLKAIRVAADVPESGRTHLELLRTDKPIFEKLIESRRNRPEEWFQFRAGKIEICSVPLPVRPGPKPSAAAGGGPIDSATGRPLIRKLGTIDLDMVETTPVVLNGKPWRYEWVRQGIGQQYWNNARQTNYSRFRDPLSGEVTPPFAEGHEFGSAFVDGDTIYVTATQSRSRVNIFASRDLRKWESRPVLNDKKYGVFNTSITKAEDEFVLAFEIDKPREEAGNPFTIRFAKSRDLREWKVTPPECNFTKERYSAAPCLRWDNGWFYLFYLEAHQGYEVRIVRSRDLITWQASPLNPVLKAGPEDKQVAKKDLTPEHRAKIAKAKNLNNSDIDFCEWQGRLLMNYSWGNQQGVEFLAEAVYDGTLSQFLAGWFPEP